MTKRPDVGDLGAVSPESLARAQADEDRAIGNGGGNLIAAIQGNADKEIAQLEREAADMATAIRAKFERIAALRAHSVISPKT